MKALTLRSIKFFFVGAIHSESLKF